MSEEASPSGLPPGAVPPSPEMLADAVAQTERFIEEVAPNLGRLFGMDLRMKVGQLAEGAGMATDAESGDVIVDPRFFLETGNGSPEAGEFGILHETAAHLRRVVMAPRLSERINGFSRQGKPQAMFYNVLEDIAGNRLIHAALPRFKGIAEGLYREKLFPETDYSEIPRHMQFLYKTIREAMVPDQPVVVLPEVEEALSGLRNYQGQGDVLAYSTITAKSATQAMTHEERDAIWMNIVYPVYEQLLEQDRQDERFQSQPGEGEDGSDQTGSQAEGTSGQGQEQAGQPSSQPSPNGQAQAGEQGKSDNRQFGQYYRDYEQNRHPEPMGETDQDKLQEGSKERAKPSTRPESHEALLDRKIREETGHSLHEQRQYDAEILRWQDAIQEMRDVYQRVIQEQIATKRGLSRRPHPEGAVLDPDRLVQTVIDVRNHVAEPEAFRDYEQLRGHTESIGKTNYIFVLDVSASMNEEDGSKAKAAASSGVIGLEGLAAMQRDVEAAEAAHKMDLDLDIRTAMYSFGEGVTCLKPLSTKITPKERLDAYGALRGAKDNGTRDYLAMEALEALPDESDRRRIVIVISDGETFDPGGNNTSARTRRSVDRLRGKGWFVYGISIGSDEAERLYHPTSRRVDDPERVPETIRNFIEATIS